MKDKNLQLDLTDDFKCGELLLDADEDREAFKLFFRVAIEEKRQDAIDKMLYIALKNKYNPNLLDYNTWNEINQLPKNEKGFEYTLLLLHFMYYTKEGLEENKKAYKYLVEYFECCKKNGTEESPIAYLQMGICLDFGVGIEADQVDAAKALKYYQKALDGGCLAAYGRIVLSYIYGADNLEVDQESAKQILMKAITYFKKQVKGNSTEIKPFFEGLVDCCFHFTDNNIRNDMLARGKKSAQYMIDHDIKGGYRLMGDFFLYSNEDFNMTMAKNYYMEAIKNKESAAYGQLAMINSIEGNRIETFRLAHQGCSKNHSFSYSTLGKMYEEQGNEYKENDDRAKKCYYAAWNCYEKAYYRFGLSPENLGYLYLDKQILPEGFKLKELERILEIGAKQLRTESIKCYLRLILKKNGKTVKDSEINCEMGNGLPEEDREKFEYYLEKGAYTGDVKFIEEYIISKTTDEKTKEILYGKLFEKQPFLNVDQIKSIYKYADETTKAKVTRYILGQPFIDAKHIELIYKLADDKTKAKLTKCILKQRFVFSDQIKSIYENADEKTKFKLTNKLLKEPYLLDGDKMKSIYNNSDEKTKAKLFRKLLGDSYLDDDQIEFIYEYADEKTKAKLSKKLINNSYITSNKQLFVEILDNYEGRQDNSFKLWLSKSTTNLFFNENKDELIILFNRIKEGIEKTEDDGLKKMWMSLQSNVNAGVWQVIEKLDDESIKELCASYRKDDGGIDWEVIHKLLSESGDEDLKERFDLVRTKIDNAYWGVVQTNFAVINELLSAFNNSKDADLKEIYEKFNNKWMNFINSLFSDTTDE